MSKELTNKQSNEVQVFSDTTYMGAADEITSQDVQIPVIMLMQSNSEIVLDDDNEIKTGDFVHSLTHEVMGHKEKKPLELCIVDMFKTQVWREGKNWIKTLDWEPHMEGEYDFEFEGKPAKKHKVYNYVVFEPSKVRTIELPTGPAYVASPLIVRIKGAFAKKLNTLIKDYAAFGQPSWCMSFNLTSHQEKNDEGTYQQYEFKNGKATNKETQLAAAQLCKSIKDARAKGQMKVDDKEEQGVKDVTPESEKDMFTPAQDVKADDLPNYAPGI